MISAVLGDRAERGVKGVGSDLGGKALFMDQTADGECIHDRSSGRIENHSLDVFAPCCNLGGKRSAEPVEQGRHPRQSYASTATSSARLTISLSEVWRSLASISSLVMRQSVMVQIVSALTPKRAASV